MTTRTTRERHYDLQNHPDALLREEDAAVFLGFTPRALQEWRHRGSGPPFVRISSRAIRYRRADLIAWATERREGAPSNAPVRNSGQPNASIP